MFFRVLCLFVLVGLLAGCAVPYRRDNVGFGELNNRDATGRIRDAGDYK